MPLLMYKHSMKNKIKIKKVNQINNQLMIKI